VGLGGGDTIASAAAAINSMAMSANAVARQW
jgi:hypothetical protein